MNVEKRYQFIYKIWDKHLKEYNVKIPKLKRKYKGEIIYTKSALALLFLTRDIRKGLITSKKELTSFIRLYFPETVDVQNGRHLSTQKGWNILKNGKGLYTLDDITKPFFKYKFKKRNKTFSSFDDIKSKFNNRCFTCGSKENEIHYKYGGITVLHKAHKNPNYELNDNNTIAQCQYCNQIYKDKFIFDDYGFILKQNESSKYWE